MALEHFSFFPIQGLVLLPVSMFLTIWSYNVSVARIVIEFMAAFLLSVYIIVMAALSPCPLFKHTWFGSALIVFAWIVTQLLFMRVRCLIATRLERFGKRALIANGALTMFGQVVGAVIIFLVVNIYGLLEDQKPCSLSDTCS